MDFVWSICNGRRHDKLKKRFPYEVSCGILQCSNNFLLSEMDEKETKIMKHVKTLNTKRLQNTVKKGGCGECQTSCQSACKTSCTVGNQSCENKNN